MKKINLKTKEITSEVLPKCLKGLKQESLNNLSWTDISLGLQDFGFWVEREVSIEYNAETHKLDGTYTYELDEDNFLVITTRNVAAKSPEEIQAELDEQITEKLRQAEQAVDAHILEKVKEKGYTNTDSIAKYLVEGNKYYEECKTLSLWIGNVWDAVNKSTATTVEELLAELPKLEV